MIWVVAWKKSYIVSQMWYEKRDWLATCRIFFWYDLDLRIFYIFGRPTLPKCLEKNPPCKASTGHGLTCLFFGNDGSLLDIFDSAQALCSLFSVSCIENWRLIGLSIIFRKHFHRAEYLNKNQICPMHHLLTFTIFHDSSYRTRNISQQSTRAGRVREPKSNDLSMTLIILHCRKFSLLYSSHSRGFLWANEGPITTHDHHRLSNVRLKRA